MIVLTCAPQDFDAVTGECAVPFYADAPFSFFSGWAVADVRALVAAVLVFLATAYVIRLLHREASNLYSNL